MLLRQHLPPRLLQRLSQVLGRDLTSRQEADPPPSPVVAAADTKGAPAAYAAPESPLRRVCVCATDSLWRGVSQKAAPRLCEALSDIVTLPDRKSRCANRPRPVNQPLFGSRRFGGASH